MTVSIDDIVFDISIYPRGEWAARTVERYSEALSAGEVLPPIVIEEGTNRLLDGLHRWKAHQQVGKDTIEAEVHEVPAGVPAKLYAASLSARHGDRMTGDDLKHVAREVVAANAEFSMQTVARLLGVGRDTVGRWVGDITDRRQAVRRIQSHLLVGLGWSSRKTGAHLGISHTQVARDVESDIACHLDDLLCDALEGLPDECKAVADEMRERLVFGRWTAEEQDLLASIRAGQTVVVNYHRHGDLVAWATSAGLFERVDRKSVWGNPFVLDDDGDRSTVIASYRDHYLPHKPSLLANVDRLAGKALGCWCAPAACHGDVLAELAAQ